MNSKTDKAGDGDVPRLVSAGNGLTIMYRGRALLSRFEPEKQACRLAAARLPAKDRTLYFCPSPLLGYGLSDFAGALPATSAIFCVEKDAALFNLCAAQAGNTVFGHDRIRNIQAESVEKMMRAFFKAWPARRFRRIEELVLTGGRALNAEFYDECAYALHEKIATEWSNAMTLTRLGRLYARNLFRNIPALGRQAALSHIDFGGRPVLVAGAGPSLDGALAALTQSGAQPAIIAVDTALAPLVARGLTPDLVVALESQHWNLADFTGWGGKPLPLAMDLSALAAHAEFSGGAPYFFWTPWTKLRLWKRMASFSLLPCEIPPLGSVGLCAVFLALKLGAGPVVLAGIDFSFTIDCYHARGTAGHKAALRRQNRFGGLYNSSVFRAGTERAVSKTGEAVRSDPSMSRYRRLFEAELRRYGEGRLFDIEGTGLPLGIPVLSMEKALSLLHGGSGNNNRRDGETQLYSGDRVMDITAFLESERNMLVELRTILTEGGDAARLDELVDMADYLWAHFPECAAAGSWRPPLSDLSFLKRLRAEIDPFLAIIERSLSL
ncbi:MAG: DUF115 domain-containing protein [Spirochaetaceae bacterium]|nr:DUF115 domain-containing protein [Spirochaetaceae bacterium]